MPADYSTNYSKWDHFDDDEVPSNRAAEILQSDTARKIIGGLSGMRSALKGADDPTKWTEGLSAAEQRAWLCDCYAKRREDFAARRPPAQAAPAERTAEAVAEDFLVFCRLAAQTRAVPPGWDWKAFLIETAVARVRAPFDKEHASRFSLLVETGSTIYLTTPDAARGSIETKMRAACRGALSSAAATTSSRSARFALFATVGGEPLWREFLDALSSKAPPQTPTTAGGPETSPQKGDTTAGEEASSSSSSS
mmetsp:Transcript_11925/g.48068  ORF Transcript_11925/g.48068 Transcript_11925/m.48068 type:complete len:252 (-) Transcript_11925:12-767(-)